jgi:hypothetical protein
MVMKEGGPLHAKTDIDKYCERLRNTGREYGIAELKKRHPQLFA